MQASTAPQQEEGFDLVTAPLDPARFDVIEVANVGIAGAGKHRGWANVEVAISNGHETVWRPP